MLAAVLRRFLASDYANVLGEDDDLDLDLILDGTVEISNEEFQLIKRICKW